MKKKLGSDKATYNPVEKIHSFPYSEYNLYTLVNIFKEKNFELDDLVKELYDKIDSFKSDNYVPGIYDYNLKNISTLAVDFLNKELGSPSSNNLLLYKDRSILHGLNYFDQHDLDKCSKEYSSLSVKIANRTNTNIKVLKAKYTFDLLVQSLMELDRFPIMFIVPNDSAYDTISEIHQHMRNVVSPEECSVMFRLDNQGEGLEFNNYIKKEKINNKLDVNSKVVYIIDNKVPKPLLKSEWEPKAIVVADTGNIPNTRRVLECFCEKDLIIFYESSDSPSTRYFFNRKLETI